MRARLPRSLPRVDDRTRTLAIGACAVLALSVALTPWFALDRYVANGWDASWWARAALVAAVAAIVALRLRRDRVAAALIVVALACVAVRAIVPPDFGFAFDGLHVPIERRFGLWIALAASVAALALALRLATRGAPSGR